MEELWRRITGWFATNVPPESFHAAKGASVEEVAVTEEILGFPLPKDLRESFLIHNGVDRGAFFLNYSLMSLVSLADAWRIGLAALRSGMLDALTPAPDGPIRAT